MVKREIDTACMTAPVCVRKKATCPIRRQQSGVTEEEERWKRTGKGETAREDREMRKDKEWREKT